MAYSITKNSRRPNTILKYFRMLRFLLPIYWFKRLSPQKRLILNCIILGLIVIVGPFVVKSIFFPEKSDAAWFNDNWIYRQVATVTNSNGSVLTNLQVSMTVNTATLITDGKMKSDCSDIRLTTQNGTLLPHWIETGINACNTTTTTIWFRIPSLPTSGAPLLLYYGNPSATSIADGNKVFELFDDFTGSTLNASKWSEGTVDATSGTSFTVTGGNLSGGNNDRFVRSTASYTGDYIAETRVYNTTPATNGFTTIGFFGTGSNNFGILDHNGSSYARNDASWINFAYNGNTQWNRDKVKVVGTSATYYRTGETIGNITATVTNSGISTEHIRVGTRYDAVGYDQNFVATWDFILVRKAVATEPSVSLGSQEQSPGPVAYWSMDEGSGTTVNDKTSRGNNGTISGAAWKPTSECKVGKCLFFDGTNDSVDFGNISQRASISGNLTIAFWMKPTNITKGRQNPVSKRYQSEFQFTLETNTSLSYYHGNGTIYTSFSSPATLKQSEWQQVVLTRDTSTRTLKYYINGKLVKTQAYSSTYDPVVSSSSFLLGNGYAGYYQGYLDEVILFATAKSADEIKALFTAGEAGVAAVKGTSTSIGSNNKSALNQGLVGHWKMDETSWNGTAGEVGDSSGSGNDGTSINGAEATSSAKFGHAGYFAGVDEYVSLGTPTSMTSRTYSIWIKPNAGASSNGRDGVFGETAGTRIDYGNGVGSTSFHALVLLTSGSPAYKELTGTGNGTSGWSHLVLVIDNPNGKASFYVNGRLSSTATWTTSSQSVNTSGAQYLGYVNSAAKLNGNLDEARLYNRALSPSEVSQLYNYAPSAVAYYDFEEKEGVTLNDKSGNGNTSTAFGGSPNWTQGKYGGGLSFDGTSDYVRINQPILTATDNTVSFWMKTPVQPRSYNRILSDSTNGIDLYFTSTGTNGLYGTIGNSVSGWTMLNPDLTDSWYYVSLVSTASDGSTRAYLNGKLQSTTNKTYGSMTIDDLYIGSQAGGSSVYKYQGVLDELRFYNYARTPGQITEDMNAGHPIGGSPIGSQLAYYKLDEGTGTTANDSVGNNNGTLSSTTWTNSGKYNKALAFNGTSGSLTLNSTVGAVSTYGGAEGASTISMWIYPESDNSQRQLASYIGGWRYIALDANGELIGMARDCVGNVNLWHYGNTQVPLNQWSHIVIELTGTGAKYYINGKLDAELNNPNICIYQAGTAQIGMSDVGWDYFSGKIDDIKAYTTTLTPEQIKIDYSQNQALVLGAVGTEADGKTPSNSSDRAYCPPGDTTATCGPVGEWKFDEKNGTTSNDTSGNGETGTITNAVWTQGKIGAALSFDGNGDYVNIADTSTLEGLSGTTFTAWINPSVISGSQDILQKENTYNFRLTGTEIECWIHNGTGYVNIADAAIANLSTNTWSNVACTWTAGSGGKIYVNGKDATVNVQTAASMTTNTSAIRIGSRNTTEYFNGKIDQVQVYNYARTPSQIAWDYNRGAPVAHYKLDECQGGTVHSSTQPYDATLNGTITIGATGTQTSIGTCETASTAWGNGAIGKFNSSLFFDGTDDYVNMGQPTQLQLTGSMSISSWINTTDANLGGIVSKWYNTVGNRGYRFLINNGTISFVVSTDGTASTTISHAGSYNSGSWIHVAVTYDAPTGTARLYKNGSVVTTNASFPTSIFNSPVNVNLGTSDAGTTGANTLSGQIDDVQIFNYALTPNQIKTVQNQGSIRFGP